MGKSYNKEPQPPVDCPASLQGAFQTRMNNTPSDPPSPKKPPYRIAVRMSAEERTRIGRKATLAHLSISRFLVESALSEGTLLPQNKTRLRWLLTLFERTGERLRSVVACPALRRAEPATRQELTAALHLVEALTEEMRKRLG